MDALRLIPKHMSSSHRGGRRTRVGRGGRARASRKGAPQFLHSTSSSLFSAQHFEQKTIPITYQFNLVLTTVDILLSLDS